LSHTLMITATILDLFLFLPSIHFM
jgi:hypothetical protein